MAKQLADVVKFACPRCKAGLRVPMKFAGRYIACPKCKNKIPVPESQAEADAEGKPYDVSELTYAVPEKCARCHAKMKKGSVLCVKCGFDYRSGKHLEYKDKTRRLGEDVTYKAIFKAPFETEVTSQLTMLISGLIAISGVGATLRIVRWLKSTIEHILGERGFEITMTVLNSIYSIVALYLALGLWFRTMVGACSRKALGVSTEPDNKWTTGLYHIPIRLVSLAPLALVGLVWYQKYRADSAAFTITPPMIFVASLAMLWNIVYTTLSVGSYSVDMTLNPLNAAYWLGKCFVDLLLLAIYFTLFVAVFWGPAVGLFYYLFTMFAEDDLIKIILLCFAVLVGEIFWAYTCIAVYASLGLVIRKNADW